MNQQKLEKSVCSTSKKIDDEHQWIFQEYSPVKCDWCGEIMEEELEYFCTITPVEMNYSERGSYPYRHIAGVDIFSPVNVVRFVTKKNLSTGSTEVYIRKSMKNKKNYEIALMLETEEDNL